MRFARLEDWLQWQEGLHSRKIDLGIERCQHVLGELGLIPAPFQVITVGGTNGKGSCAALLESMLEELGQRTGVFTSPHLCLYNERIRIDRTNASDEQIMAAFSVIDQARGDTSLTYFEFATIAAISLFAQTKVDAAVMEVGLGGRLDASNSLDPDVAIITSLALDHQNWLGDTLSDIAREKAGIMRPGRPAVCGEPEPPASLVQTARELGAVLSLRGTDFFVEPSGDDSWAFSNARQRMANLPLPALAGGAQLSNAACAIQALSELGFKPEALEEAARVSLASTVVDGRFQLIVGQPTWILDVAHNPASAALLARNLSTHRCAGRRHLVLGIFGDKDVLGFARELKAQTDRWYAVATTGDRGVSAESLAEQLGPVLGTPAARFDSVEEACVELSGASAADQVVVAGSFSVVGPALAWLRERDANLATLGADRANGNGGIGHGTTD